MIEPCLLTPSQPRRSYQGDYDRGKKTCLSGDIKHALHINAQNSKSYCIIKIVIYFPGVGVGVGVGEIKYVLCVKSTDNNCFLTPSQPRRSYQGDPGHRQSYQQVNSCTAPPPPAPPCGCPEGRELVFFRVAVVKDVLHVKVTDKVNSCRSLQY